MGNNEAGKPQESDKGKKPAFQISKEPVIYGKGGEDVHKYEATLGEPPKASAEPPAYEDLGTLPATYGSKSLFLIARDPHWLFGYWDIDWQSYPSSKMHGGKVHLKVYNADGAEVYSSEVNPEARNWYVSVSNGNATFYAEIGFVNLEGAWEVIARSNDATTPSDGISEDVSDSFATVPYHIAFQKIIDLVKASMGEGESLLSALARIQNEGRKVMFVLGSTPNWTDEQRRILATLLGHELSELVGLGSAEIDGLLRTQLTERLFSESASALLARGGAGGESSLFSPSMAFGSWKELSSWTIAGESSFLSSWLSSWSGQETAVLSSWLASWGGAKESAFWSSYMSSALGGSSALSSWLSSWSAGQEALSSYLSSAGGLSALSSGLSSWGGASEAFWSSYLGSWGGASSAMASWSGAQQTMALSSWLSSWGGVSETFWSSYLSSFGGASALSSWLPAGGASESFWSSWLSSWPGAIGASESAFWSSWMSSWSGAAGSSWSAQPFGESKEFSVHGNAEVIFHGGTHPDAKVWVDGKPISLSPDGSFRFHFKFPDGDYSIPIVTESPDGAEQRSATLRFERNTARHGSVGATAQPAFMGEPFSKN